MMLCAYMGITKVCELVEQYQHFVNKRNYLSCKRNKK